MAGMNVLVLPVIICHTSIGLVLMMVKELDLKLTLGMAGRRQTESPPNEETWGGG